MTQVLAGGDSFIWGSELSDCQHCGPDGYSKSTFPALLSTSYNCVAFPGSGNESIARRVIDYCETNPTNDVFVIVCWTFDGRYEFKFDSGWNSINSWSAGNYYNNTPDGDQNDLVLAQVNKTKELGNFEFAKAYFKHIGWSEYWETYTTLKSIVYLQNYLLLKQIPFLFTCADNSFLVNYTYKSDDISITALKKQIDFQKWYMFPGANESWNTTEPRGFYQWAVENKYKCGSQNHPLEDAHQKAAELMREKFNELVKNSLQQNNA